MIGQRIGPYEVLAKLGEGGMGEVYRARDANLGRDVAIKVLPDAFAQDAERLARFEREAKTLASLSHPNIAIVHGFEKAGEIRALVMELVDGPTLADRIAQGPIALDETLAMARQIADALDTAHDQGIVHRDLKPANVKVRADGTVKVLDFGLAKLIESGSGARDSGFDRTMSPTITSPALMSGVGVLLGTAAYMSPEQARGRPVDRRADIWAFGCVFWEMLLGERLFRGEDITETLASVVKDQPDWNRVPVRVRALLQACLERDPRKRLRDIGDVWRLLADESPVSSAPAPRVRAWTGWAAATVFLVATAALGIALLRQPSPAVQPPMRFHLAFPANTRPARGTPALSPDGQHVAFVATDLTTGENHLWVHDLNALEPRRLAGTDGAVGSPFWSSDSRMVVFATARRQPMNTPNTLKKIATAGGPALTLGTIPSILRGGFWSPGGDLVLGVAGQPILRMPSAGGATTPISVMTEGESGHAFPSLLSDGRKFVYMRLQGANRGGIYLGSLDRASTSADSRVLDIATNVTFVPARDVDRGYLMFARGDVLLAAPFDVATGRVTGEQVPIAQGVGRGASDPNYVQMTGAANGALLYEDAGTVPLRQLIWYDRHGTSLSKLGESALFSGLVLSPSGSRAVVAIRHDERNELWVMDVERGTRSPFVQNTGTNWAPVWSPDEATIIYSSSQSAPTSLYRRIVAGGREDRVVEGANASDWSRDGRFVLFQRRGNDEMWVLPDPGHGTAMPARLGDMTGSDATFSPDGRLIAYVSDRSGMPEVYLSTFNPSALSDRGLQIQVSVDGGVKPRWRGDGRELVFLSNRRLLSVPVESGPTPKIGKPELLFTLPGDASAWDLTRDASRFLVLTNQGEYVAPPFTVLLNWQSSLSR